MGILREVKEIVANSSEDEVRSLLFLLLSKIGIEAQTDEELAKDMKKIYSDFLDLKERQKRSEDDKSVKVVHIAFGASSAGSLKNIQDEEKVIFFSDQFSIGPIWKLHEETGLLQRYKWLMNHINVEEEYLFTYLASFKKTVSVIEAIDEHVRIFIWAGNNSDEQTALRYVLYLLRKKRNTIMLINTTVAYKTVVAKPEVEYVPSHTGEIVPEKLGAIYDRNKTNQPLSQKERARYEFEWGELSNQIENLRVWEDEQLFSVDDGYYDEYIIQTARKLHDEQKNKGFIKSARLIGEVIGHLDQRIGDEYFEYRLMHLVVKGVFEIEGVPRAMRFYSVKLRQGY
ncbi:DUF1835 domain-containing protein [Alkalihalobacillus oceani]|uniref:DUF1835 domain-containing protein n=1 Tax=Halalkalibacter oceani TaxID=1653776 RepID=A0A9X2DPZ7_9BACI|nr:DUF1835 domain-containing protein [Halalkalibacter oceani]